MLGGLLRIRSVDQWAGQCLRTGCSVRWPAPRLWRPEPASEMVDAVRASSNRDAALLALDQGRRFFHQREFERAIRFLKRSYILSPLPEAAQLLQEAIAAVRADPHYCGECHRYRGNCLCRDNSDTPTSSRARSSPVNGVSAAPMDWLAAACTAVAQWWRHLNAAFLRVGVHQTCTGPLATIVLLLPVLLAVRFLVGGPIAAWAFGASASRTPRGAYFAGSSSIMSSIFLTVGANAALYYFRRRQGPVR